MSSWNTALRMAVDLARRHETKARFVVAGGFNTAFGLAVYPLLMWTFGHKGLHYMVALPIAQIASLSVAYVTQKTLVFRTKGNYIREFIKFSAFYMGNFALIAIVLPILVEIFHQNPVISQFVLSLGIIFVSYFWHSRVTFKREGHR